MSYNTALIRGLVLPGVFVLIVGVGVVSKMGLLPSASGEASALQKTGSGIGPSQAGLRHQQAKEMIASLDRAVAEKMPALKLRTQIVQLATMGQSTGNQWRASCLQSIEEFSDLRAQVDALLTNGETDNRVTILTTHTLAALDYALSACGQSASWACSGPTPGRLGAACSAMDG
jgi:hypothetical protein